jgi:hypothetical protein
MIRSILRKLMGSASNSSGVTLENAVDLIYKKYPGIIREGGYTPPTHRCSRWIVIRGPIVGSPTHWGTLIVEAKKIVDWASHHASATWTSSMPEQSAKQFLPRWLGDADESDESITIPDEQMLAVLQPYDQDFIYKLAIRHWCPECKELQSNVICGDKDRELAGKRSKWTSEWYCMHGHLVHAEQNEIKFF